MCLHYMLRRSPTFTEQFNAPCMQYRVGVRVDTKSSSIRIQVAIRDSVSLVSWRLCYEVYVFSHVNTQERTSASLYVYGINNAS